MQYTYATQIDKQLLRGKGRPLGPWLGEDDPIVDASPFDGKQGIYDWIQYLLRFSKELAPEIGRGLEELHGISRSERYWEILLTRDVYRLASIMLYRYKILETAIEGGEIRLTTLSEQCYTSPVSCEDYVSLCGRNGVFNWQVFSQAASFLGAEGHQEEYDSAGGEVGVESHICKRYDLLCDLWNYESKGVRSAISHHSLRLSSRKEKLLFVLATYGRGWETRKFPIRLRVDHEMSARRDKRGRTFLKEGIGGDSERGVGRFIRAAIHHNIPSVWVEAFGQLLEEVQALNGEAGTPDVILTGPMAKNAIYRLWVAESVERGADLFGVQHGAGYGDIPENALESMERHVSDRFLTWGWKRRDKDYPLPAPRLAGISKQARDEILEDHMLWVTGGGIWYEDHDYPLRLRDHLNGRGFFGQSHSDKLAFTAGLREDVKRATTVRPKKEGMEAEIEYATGGMTVKKKGGVLEQARGCTLVIVDHFPSTSFLELLRADIPVIVFDDIPEWYIEGAATTVVEALVDVGIIHRSAASAAREVNNVFGRVQEWWEKPKRQSVLEEARFRLARSAKSPMTEYASFVNQHLR